MAIMGTLYASKSVHSGAGAGRWIVILMIYIFAIVYSMSKNASIPHFGNFTNSCPAWAVGVKLFASEIQPVATRATAVSLAQSANCVCLCLCLSVHPEPS